MTEIVELIKLANETIVRELWRYPTDDWVSSVGAADINGDGDVEILAGSRDTHAYVISNGGGRIWRFSATQKWAGAVAALDYRKPGQPQIFVGDRSGTIIALNDRGTPVWREKAKHVIRSLQCFDSPSHSNPLLLAGSEDRGLYLFDAITGENIWHRETNGWIRVAHAYFDQKQGDYVIVGGSGDKNLYFYDIKGNFINKFNTGNKVHFINSITDEKGVQLLVSSDGKDVYSFDPVLFNKNWSVDVENRVLSIQVAQLLNNGKHQIILGSEDQHIYFYDDTGNLIWRHFVGDRIFSVTVADTNSDGHVEVIIGSEDNNVHALQVNLDTSLRNKIIDTFSKLTDKQIQELVLNSRERHLLQSLLWGTNQSSRSQLLDLFDFTQETSPNANDKLLPLLIKNHKRASLFWKKEAGLVRSVALGDLDNDGVPEIAASTDGGDVHVSDTDGSDMWSYHVGGRVWMVQVADLDKDGHVEVVAGASDGIAYIFDDTGKNIKAKLKLKDWIRSVYISDETDTGSYPELILGSEDGDLNLYQFNPETSEFEKQMASIPVPQSIRAVWAEDFDSDGVREIIAGADDDNVYAYTRGGIELWRFATKDRIRGLKIDDIDNDGLSEILVASEDRNIYVLDGQGKLKWRYLTPHRVLDVDTGDIDSDGHVEVILASGDGNIYILDHLGEIKWSFKVSDRVRGVRVGNLKESKRKQIIAGSEDSTIYVIDPVDLERTTEQINTLWLRETKSQENLQDATIAKYANSDNPLIKAFAIKKIADIGRINTELSSIIAILAKEHEKVVRMELANQIGTLFSINEEEIRRHMDGLSGDPDRDVREAFVRQLPNIVKTDIAVGFEYIDRFCKDTNKWVRRTLARVLESLVSNHFEKTFDRLLVLAVDGEEWVRQETARTIAGLVDRKPKDVITITRQLILAGILPEIIELIAARTINRDAKRFLEASVYLMKDDIDLSNIEDRLKAIIDSLTNTLDFTHLDEAQVVYHEWLKLFRFTNVDHVSDYSFQAIRMGGSSLKFDDVYKLFEKLNELSTILSRYLRRERMGDQVASLSEAITKSEEIRAAIYKDIFTRTDNKPVQSPDQGMSELLITQLRNIIVDELNTIRGTADLRPELLTKRAKSEDQIATILQIRNEGQSPADNVFIKLDSSPQYEIVSNREIRLEDISAKSSETVEFTIKPTITSKDLRVSFLITYDDLEAKGQQHNFADIIRFDETTLKYQHFDKVLYQAGTPNLPDYLFFNRVNEIESVKRHLNSPTENVLVFYGPRRAGKTALLRHLLKTDKIDPHLSTLVDLQGITWEKFDVQRFLYKIAKAIHNSLKNAGLASFSIKPIDDFIKYSDSAWEDFLDECQTVMKERRMLVMFDEIQELHEPVAAGHVDSSVFTVLRSFMQHRSEYFRCLFAGTHKLETIASEYWNVFFQIAIHEEIKPLDDNDAKSLIIDPADELLEYDEFAVDRILSLSGNQPYFIQLICFNLSEYCKSKEKKYITVNDVNIVLDQVLKTGHMHFSWVWKSQGVGEVEKLVLAALAQEAGQQNRGVRIDDISKAIERYDLVLPNDVVKDALDTLEENSAIVRDEYSGRYSIKTRLVGLWLRKYKQLRRVIPEINYEKLKTRF